MCKFHFQQNQQNLLMSQKINKIPAGSSVFIKIYDLKTHKKMLITGVLIAKRGKGTSSHILIRRVITKEVITLCYYIYTKTFLGIGMLGKNRRAPVAKTYNYLSKPIRWKYL